MIEKIKSALKTEYKGLGLGDKTIDRLASYVKGLVENEDDIATAVKRDDVKLIATSIQGEIDGIRKAKQAAEDALAKYKEKHPETDPNPNPDPAPQQMDEPEWAKKLREQQEAIAARFAREDREKALKAARLTVESRLKAEIAQSSFNQGVFNSTLKGFALGEKETLDEAVARLKGDYDASYKETFGAGGAPGLGTPAFGDSKSAIDHKNRFLEEQGLLPKQDK